MWESIQLRLRLSPAQWASCGSARSTTRTGTSWGKQFGANLSSHAANAGGSNTFRRSSASASIGERKSAADSSRARFVPIPWMGVAERRACVPDQNEREGGLLVHTVEHGCRQKGAKCGRGSCSSGSSASPKCWCGGVIPDDELGAEREQPGQARPCRTEYRSLGGCKLNVAQSRCLRSSDCRPEMIDSVLYMVVFC